LFTQRTLRWSVANLTPINTIRADSREWLSFTTRPRYARVIIDAHLDVQTP
jgi:hypothetical protein